MGLAHFRYGFTICCVRKLTHHQRATRGHPRARPRPPPRRPSALSYPRPFRSAEQSCGKPQLRGQPTNRALRAQRFLDDVLLRRRRQQQHRHAGGGGRRAEGEAARQGAGEGDVERRAGDEDLAARRGRVGQVDDLQADEGDPQGRLLRGRAQGLPGAHGRLRPARRLRAARRPLPCRRTYKLARGRRASRGAARSERPTHPRSAATVRRGRRARARSVSPSPRPLAARARSKSSATIASSRSKRCSSSASRRTTRRSRG